MPDRTTQTRIDLLDALLDMVEDDGASPPGTLPPVEHLRAARERADDRAALDDVRDAHAQGNAPPENTGNGAN